MKLWQVIKVLCYFNDVSYDYIELYNGYDYDVDLKGYYLSDDDFNDRIWQFNESVVIKSKDYLYSICKRFG